MAGETTSVSKGCFLIKKGGSSSPRKRLVEDLFPEVDGETDAHRKLRYANYNSCWSSFKCEIEKLQGEMNSKIFSALLDYIKRTWKSESAHEDSTAVIQEMPTAALITGVNMPDHDGVFCQLETELKQQITPYVALLRSKDCTVLKATMKSMILQFLGCDVQDEDDSPLEQPSKTISAFTMPVLCHWYKKMTQVDSSKKRRSTQILQCKDRPPLVVIFEDFEGFPPSVVQDFVLICSQYMSDLPMVLVFGIATSIATVHKVLPHAVSSVLSIERFQAHPSHTCLLEIIDKVLMTPKFAFKLGPRVFRFLCDNFLFHDFSLQSFARGLQFCMMEHFYENPLSVLCCVLPEERKEILNKMSHKQVEKLRRTMSFRRYVEGQPPSRQPLLLLDDLFTKDALAALLEDLDRYHWCFFPILKCLHLLTGNLPRHPLGKKLCNVYELSLSGNIYNLQEYKEAMSLLRVCSKDELLPLFQECLNALEAVLENSDALRYCKALEEPRDVIDGLLRQFDNLNEIPENQAPSVPGGEVLSHFASRFELQEKLLSAAKQKRKESPYDKLRQKAVDYIDQIFRKFLTSPRDIPLNEVMYFDNVHKLRQHLVGMPRVAIQTALSSPQHYLKCSCCQIDVGTVQDTLPDICIAYKLHLECGRLINLYDWLQAFTAVLDPQSGEKSTKGSPKKKMKTNDQLQARFIQAVSELQFLGFIKSTRQKTDHVQRLTWGAC